MPPQGLPDVDNFGDYGGAISNYVVGMIDPTTDEDAAQRNLYVANIAAMTHTVWRATRSFLGPTAGQTLVADPTKGFSHDAVWGSTADVRPIGTYVAAGTVDVGWPTTVTDALGVAHTVSLQAAEAAVEPSGGAFCHAKAIVVAPNRVRVYTYDSSLSTAANLVGQVVTVWVR